MVTNTQDVQSDSLTDNLLDEDNQQAEMESNQTAPAQQPAQQAQPALPNGATFPPQWHDITTLPEYAKVSLPDKQKLLTSWLGTVNKFSSDAGYKPDRDEQSAIDTLALTEGRKLGVGFVIKPDGNLESVARASQGALDPNAKTGIGGTTFGQQPYSFPIDAKSGADPKIEATMAGADFFKGIGSFLTNTYDYFSGVGAGQHTGALGELVNQAERGEENLSMTENEYETAHPTGTLGTIFEKDIPYGAESLALQMVAARGIGGGVKTGAGGSLLGRAGIVAGIDTAGDAYTRAIDNGASPNQAAIAGGINGAIAFGEMKVLGGISKLAGEYAMGANAAKYEAGLYRPTVAEMAKLIGTDAAAQAALGGAGKIAENATTKVVYDPSQPLTEGALSAAGQMSLWSLAHLPGMSMAFIRNRSEISSAAREVANAQDSYNAAQKGDDDTAKSEAQDNLVVARQKYSDILSDIAKDAPPPTNQDVMDATKIVASPEAAEEATSAHPLEVFNKKLETEVDEGKEPEPSPAPASTEPEPGIHPVFGPGMYPRSELTGDISGIDLGDGSQQVFWNGKPTDRVRVKDENGDWKYDFATPNQLRTENFVLPSITKETLGQPNAPEIKSGELASAKEVGPATTREVTENANYEKQVNGEQKPILDNAELGQSTEGGHAGELVSDGSDEAGIKPDDNARYAGTQQAGEVSTSPTHEAHALVEGGGSEKTPASPPAEEAPKDTPEQSTLRSRIEKALGKDSKNASKVVFSTDLDSPAWADPASPDKIFVNPDVLGKTLSDSDEGFKDPSKGDEYIRRLMAQKAGEEVIHNAQHEIRGDTDHDKLYNEVSPKERQKTVKQYGDDSIDPEKGMDTEDIRNRKILFNEEHARQILQRKAIGETTEDVWKHGDKPELLRYLKSLYEKIKAHIADFGRTPELSNYLKNIESVLKDAEKSGQKIPEEKTSGVAKASNPDLSRVHEMVHEVARNLRDIAESKSKEFVGDVASAGKDLGFKMEPGIEKFAVKSAGSTENKLNRSPGEIPTDLLRTTLLSDKPKEAIHDQALDLIKNMAEKGYKIFAPNGEPAAKTWHTEKPQGYIDINVRFEKEDDPIIREVQILQPHMKVAKDGRGHELYDDDKKIQIQLKSEKDPAVVKGLKDQLAKNKAEADALYAKAYADDNPSQSASGSGNPSAPRLANAQSSSGVRGPAALSSASFLSRAKAFASKLDSSATSRGLAFIHSEHTPESANSQLSAVSSAAKPPDELSERSKGIWGAMRGLANGLKADAQRIKKYTDWTKTKNVFSADLSAAIQDTTRVINSVKDTVKDPLKRDAITNYIEAKGDAIILRQRANATKDKVLRQGYETALKLTPEEKAMAGHVQKTFDLYHRLAVKWGIDLAKLDNYVPHIWAQGLEDKINTAAGRRLNTSFKHSQERTFPTHFEGEQAGFKPVTKDISSLLGSYVNDLNYAITARKFIKNVSAGKASTGEPLLAFKKGSLNHVPTEGEKKQSVLVNAGRIGPDYSHYRDDKLPSALSGWTFKGDLDGKTVFGKDTFAVHPEIYSEMRNIFDKSALKEWWEAPSQSMIGALGKGIVKGAFTLNTKGKTTLFGVIPSLFHPVQILNESISHRTVPLKLEDYKEPDLSDPHVKDWADHGSMLAPNQASRDLFMDGMNQSKDNLIFNAMKLLNNVPGGEALKSQVIDRLQKGTEATQRWLFDTFIPSQKLRFNDIVLERYKNLFAKELASGKVTMDDLKYQVARMGNNAYGHLNYIDIARNPTMQHMMQFLFLAPDFFEARLRHTGQAFSTLLGGKGGFEQAQALTFMGTGMYVAARLANAWLNDGDTKNDYPFAIVYKNKIYGMRTQIGDLHRLIGVPWQNGHFSMGGLFQNWRSWISGRESPMVRFAGEALSGQNYRGEPSTMADAIRDTLAGSTPISLQPLVRPLTQNWSQGWKNFLIPKTMSNMPISEFEQFLQSVGIQVSRYSPITRTYQMASEWEKEHGEEYPGLVKAQGQYPTSKYTPLRYALEDGDYTKAAQEFDSLNAAKKPGTSVLEGFRQSVLSPFVKDTKANRAFVDSLSPQDKQVYEAAVARRQLLLQRFSQMRQEQQNLANSK